MNTAYKGAVDNVYNRPSEFPPHTIGFEESIRKLVTHIYEKEENMEQIADTDGFNIEIGDTLIVVDNTGVEEHLEMGAYVTVERFVRPLIVIVGSDVQFSPDRFELYAPVKAALDVDSEPDGGDSVMTVADHIIALPLRGDPTHVIVNLLGEVTEALSQSQEENDALHDSVEYLGERLDDLKEELVEMVVSSLEIVREKSQELTVSQATIDVQAMVMSIQSGTLQQAYHEIDKLVEDNKSLTDRVYGLLDANNVEVVRRRAAEVRVAELESLFHASSVMNAAMFAERLITP